jgi:hypothetical protein
MRTSVAMKRVYGSRGLCVKVKDYQYKVIYIENGYAAKCPTAK